MAKPDPKMMAPRELIGTVTLSSGDTLQVYMPTIGDVMDGPSKNMNNFEALITSATGLTIEQFRILPFPDGASVIDKLSVAFDAMQLYIGRQQPPQKPH
jgi:hypothetical protein